MIEPRTKRLAADIGGTFTDVAALDEATGNLLLGKTLQYAAAPDLRHNNRGSRCRHDLCGCQSVSSRVNNRDQ